MKKLSKLAAIFAALVMACAVTGCGGGEEESGNSAENNSTSSNNGTQNENSGTNDSGTSDENKETTYSDSKSATLDTWSSSKVYKFSAVANSSYTITWTNGTGAKIEVDAGTNTDRSSYFYGKTTSGQTITMTSSEDVYITVKPYSSNHTGDFTLKVSSKDSSVTLTDVTGLYTYSDSVTGTISDANGYIVYRFAAVASSSYDVECTNSGSANMTVSAGNDAPFNSYFNFLSTTANTITPTSSGYVYIKVAPTSRSESNTGSFTLSVKSNDSPVALSKYGEEPANFTASASASGSTVPNLYWKKCSITNSKTYYITTPNANTTYYLYVCDKNNDSECTLDVQVAYEAAANTSVDFTNATYTDDGYSSPITITSSDTFVCINVKPKNDGETGSFKLCVVDSDGEKQAIY
ncbi:MAG: hypothetical protein K6B43_13950 [Treponema sp.]|nr:hypothetical protein [Treponema sp.]